MKLISLTVCALLLSGIELMEATPVPSIPASSPKPSTNSLITRSPPRDNPCKNIGNAGIPHEDCEVKPGHEFEADGSCRVWASEDCKAYCEWTRAGFYDHPIQVPGSKGPKGLTKGISVSVTESVNVNVGGALASLISAGVSYEWTSTKTSTETWNMNPEPGLGINTEWVYFPTMITSCGIITEKKKKTYSAGFSVCPGTFLCTMPKAKDPTCEGSPKTTQNICTTTPLIGDNDQPTVDFIQRYVDPAGYPLPLDKQTPNYRDYCLSSKTTDGSPVC